MMLKIPLSLIRRPAGERLDGGKPRKLQHFAAWHDSCVQEVRMTNTV